MLNVSVGNQESAAAVQYGGHLGQDAHYRVYARDVRRRAFDTSTGADAHNARRSPQAGFRVDWNAGPADTFTLQGDVHDGRTEQAGARDARSTGADLVAHWRHAISDTSRFRVRAYYDRVHRRSLGDGSGFSLDTWDVEAQHNLAIGDHHQVVWSVGDRVYHYDITPRIGTASSLLWDPAVNTQNLANAFVQDQIALDPRTQLTLGLKAESDPYSGVSLMPSARLAWQPSDNQWLWTSVSRAVRTPTPFDQDVVEKLGSVTFLVGNPAFKREKLTAYEVGWRGQVARRATLSVSAYYNVYDDLKSIEFSPTGLPLLWGNGMRGHSWGLETWGSYAVRDWWQLGAGLVVQRQRLRFKPGSSGLLGVAQVGNDPPQRGFIRSTMNLSSRWSLYVDLRGVDALPDPKAPGYVELDARLGWRVSDRLELSLAGFNLLRPWHQEYVFPDSNRIARAVSFDTRLTF
jgi:iron complex outermembrane receptor protein